MSCGRFVRLPGPGPPGVAGRRGVPACTSTSARRSRGTAGRAVEAAPLHDEAPWCGTIERALDPTGAVPGRIEVYFEYYPHSAAAAAAGTLVATEGGPGIPGHRIARGVPRALLRRCARSYDVLIMDNRGTGRSAAIDCKGLQEAATLTEANIGACGRSLGAGAFLYSSALAGDDLAAFSRRWR